ncbi:hypothetical protein M3Y99_00311500 [Aphelenchoides fujianensis]|nr:hypothetical protein M3Y99_00311500 [Aphelenchoides fujianensis]
MTIEGARRAGQKERPFKQVNALQLLFAQVNGAHLETRIPRLDMIARVPLRLGSVFELCGDRHSGKQKIAHRIIADFLLKHQLNGGRVFVLDYAQQFSTGLLARHLLNWSDEETPALPALLSRVSVANVRTDTQLVQGLKSLHGGVTKGWLWGRFHRGAPIPCNLVVIMDVGSLLHESMYRKGMNGAIMPDKVYREVRKLQEANGTVMLLNHCKQEAVYEAGHSVLGGSWTSLVPNRIYLDRFVGVSGCVIGVHKHPAGFMDGGAFILPELIS